MTTTRKLITIGCVSFLTAGVGYCLYFDYKRRHDHAFRKKLLKEQRRFSKHEQHEGKQASREAEEMLAAAVDAINAEPLPTTPEGKENFFMEQVGMGEMLAMRMPQGAVPAAISFFKAYKVYPSPQELMTIYQKTMPPQVFVILLEMIKLDAQRTMRSSKLSPGLPRSSSDGPVIEEITGEERAAIDSARSKLSASKPASSTSTSHQTKGATPPPSTHTTAVSSNVPSSSAENKPESVPETVPASNQNKLGTSTPHPPSESGSVNTGSQTANSFVLVDEEAPLAPAAATGPVITPPTPPVAADDIPEPEPKGETETGQVAGTDSEENVRPEKPATVETFINHE